MLPGTASFEVKSEENKRREREEKDETKEPSLEWPKVALSTIWGNARRQNRQSPLTSSLEPPGSPASSAVAGPVTALLTHMTNVQDGPWRVSKRSNGPCSSLGGF